MSESVHCDVCKELRRLINLIEGMNTYTWTNSDGSKLTTINKDKLLDILEREFD